VPTILWLQRLLAENTDDREIPDQSQQSAGGACSMASLNCAFGRADGAGYDVI
jgi:hypothetical protein